MCREKETSKYQRDHLFIILNALDVSRPIENRRSAFIFQQVTTFFGLFTFGQQVGGCSQYKQFHIILNVLRIRKQQSMLG